MPDLGPGQSAAADDDADIDVDDDKPDNTGFSNVTEFQGMKIEVRSGIEVPKWLKLYEWGVADLHGFPLAPEIMDLIWGKWVTSNCTPRHCQFSFEATKMQ